MRRAYWPEQEPGRESTAPFYEQEQRRGSEMRGRRYDSRQAEYRNPIGFDTRSEYRNPIGFRMQGYRGREGGGAEMGYAQGDSQPLSQRDAKEWVYSMRLADGSQGPRWKFKEVNRLLKEKGWNECDPLDMWVGMNALYSDLCDVNSRYGITAEHTDYWMEAAKAFWLEDDDAVEDKLTAYYNYIVE